MYYLTFPDPHTWSDAQYRDTHPLARHRSLCDIMHCPGKSGHETCSVLDKQFASKGLTRYDAVNGVGDGGGENEGKQDGVHAHMEAACGSYVRRRCQQHFPWRTCSAGLDAAGDLEKSTRAISVYLRDGITWRALQCIAVTPIANGGLGLVRDGSAEYKAVFGNSPPSIIVDRPESAVVFLKWWRQRCRLLTTCILNDLHRRKLKMKDAQIVHDTLTNRADVFKREVLYILLEKSLFIYYWIKSKHRLVEHDTFDSILKKASAIITSLQLDDHTLQLLGFNREDVIALGIPNAHMMSWVEFVCNVVPDTTNEEADAMVPVCNSLHELVATRMAAHQKLTASTMERSYWVAAKMLSKNPTIAKEGANSFHDYLIRLRHNQMTLFERHFSEDDVLMNELAGFKDLPEASCLWHTGPTFSNLYMFLCARFLAAPDHVVDCEGTHAKWQWITLVKRGIKFRLLNAILKIKSWLDFYGHLPAAEELREHYQSVVETERAQLQAVLADPNIARGLRYDMVYNERFNLDPGALRLVRERIEHQRDVPQTPTTQWGMYVRFLFESNHIYAFQALGPDLFLYVAENKSVPNRDAPAFGAAEGRHLTIAWFELSPEQGDGYDGYQKVIPCTGDNGLLELTNCTIAEVSRAAGYYPVVPLNATERDIEVIHETHLLDHQVVVFDAERQTYTTGGDWGASWCFLVRNGPEDIEEHTFDKRDLAGLTKMALARRIQLRDNLTNDQRNALWPFRKDLLTRMVAGDAAPEAGSDESDSDPDDAAGVIGDAVAHGRGGGGAPGRGAAGVAAVGGVGARGRGHGRGRGRGRRGRGRGRA